MPHKLVIVESPAKARTIGGYLGDDYVVESSVGHIRDLPNSAADMPASIKDKPWGRLAVDIGERLHAVLRRSARQEEPHRQAQGPAQGRRRALPRHRRGPRGRGHRLAPPRRAEAEGAGAPDGVPRDHQGGDPGGRREPARDHRRPRRRPGDPPHPRPAVRLRGLAGAVEEGHVRAVGRPRAVGGDPAGRRPRARADGVPHRVVLGPRGHLRRRLRQGAPDVPGQALLGRRACGSPGAPTSAPTASSRASGRATASTWTATPPRAWSPRCATRRTPCARSSPSRTAARRTRRSAPRPCSRRRAASSA